MNFVIPEKVDRSVLDAVESSLTASTMDDLLEASLSYLLDVDHVKADRIRMLSA